MAESFLKHEGAEQARATFESLVNRRLEKYPKDGAFAHQSAQEIVPRDVLRYTT